MKRLNKYLKEIERQIPNAHEKDEKVSAQSVGWQLDHTLRVIIGISKELAKEKEADYKSKRNVAKSYIFLTKTIPRGKGRAPERVVSKDNDFTTEKLSSLLDLARESLAQLKAVPKDNFFTHPLFGDLKKKKAIKFIGIHTKHHLKIVRDILT